MERMQVGDGGASPAAVALRDLIPAEAVLLAVVEVVVGGQASASAASRKARHMTLRARASLTGSGPSAPWNSLSPRSLASARLK